MYNILLVDDEYFVIDGFANAIQWKNFNIHHVYTAKNGQQALDIMSKHEIHIVITDIKMPIMNGIELIKHIRTSEYKCKIIILSGYEDFEYAKKAITFKIMDYLLKPVPIKKLQDTITQAITVLDYEKQQATHEIETEKILNESMPLLIERFYHELIHGNYNADMQNFLGISLQATQYTIAIFHIDNMSTLKINGAPLSEKEKLLTKLRLLNNMDIAFSKNIKNVRISNHDDIIMILTPDTPIKIHHIIELFELFQHQTYIQENITISIGVGKSYKCLHSIHHSYEEAKTALKHKLYRGNNTIIQYDDINIIEGDAMDYFLNEKRSLYDTLNTRNTKKLTYVLQSIRQKIAAKEHYPIEYVRQLGMEFIISASLILYEKNEHLDKIIPNIKNPIDHISKLETIDDITNLIEAIFKQIIAYLNHKGTQKNLHIIEFIETFVENNLENEISLEVLSTHLHLTPNYIGSIFKDATDICFSDYLLKTRMEQAKILLKDPSYKIYEVALHVGYKNPHYFSKLFREYTGVTPSTYRQ